MGWSGVTLGVGMATVAVTGGMLLNACGRHAASSGATIRVTGDATDNGKPVSSGAIASGDLIELHNGTARINLPAGGHLELRAGSSIRWTDPPTLVGGDVLVE